MGQLLQRAFSLQNSPILNQPCLMTWDLGAGGELFESPKEHININGIVWGKQNPA